MQDRSRVRDKSPPRASTSDRDRQHHDRHYSEYDHYRVSTTNPSPFPCIPSNNHYRNNCCFRLGSIIIIPHKRAQPAESHVRRSPETLSDWVTEWLQIFWIINIRALAWSSFVTLRKIWKQSSCTDKSLPIELTSLLVHSQSASSWQHA